MSQDDTEIYANVLSDVDSDVEELLHSNDEESDTDSDIIVRRLRNTPTIILISDSDDNENNSVEDLEWTQDDHNPQSHNCIQQPGLQVPSAKLDVKTCLELFIGEELLNLFVTETNTYYHQQSNSNTGKHVKGWTDITIAEMKQFLALMIIMGLIKKSEKDEYWSTNPLLWTPIFGRTMTRNRFRQIWKYWHFNNNEQCQDRLDKIKPVYTHLNQKFQTVYKPKKELALEEGIIPWRGNLSFCTYRHKNYTKYGILVRMVCEATSGYICNLEIYCGQEKTQIGNIVSILSPFLNLWHDVYMDNYHTTVTTAEELLRQRTNICGTIKKHKGVPKSLINDHRRESSTAFRRKGDILIQSWKTTRNHTYMISTIHPATVNEITHPKTNKKTVKPTCVVEYDKYMKNVDRADRHLSYFSLLLKTKKWTKKAVLHLLNCALFNAYQIYTKNSTNNMKYKKFLLTVAGTWLDGAIEISEEKSTSTTPVYVRRASKYDPQDRLSADMKRHRIIKIVGRGKIANPRRACRVCTAAKRRSSTAHMCSSCSVPLHPGKCFENYHTKVKY